MNTIDHRIQPRPWLRQCPRMANHVAAVVIAASAITPAQTVNLDRVVADLEPEIQRTLL